MMYKYFKIPFLAIERYELDRNVAQFLPQHLAEQHQMIAIEKIGNILTIGITNLEDVYILPFLEQHLNYIIIPFLINLDEWINIFPLAYINEKQINYVG